jgi:hypothetical protein
MTKVGKGVFGAMALLGVSASPAVADGFKSWEVCGGNWFNTCAAVQLNVVGTNVTLSVRNLSGLYGTYGGTVFTAIGLFNVPTSVNAVGGITGMTGPTRGSDSPVTWGLSNNAQVGGGIQLDLASNINGVNDGIASNCLPGDLPGGVNQLWMNPTCGDAGVTNSLLNGGWVVLNFNVSETWDPSTTELLVKGQNGPDGMSTECFTGEAGNCSVVPEPISMLLLGTGLAGMGGAGFLRRRRRHNGDVA